MKLSDAIKVKYRLLALLATPYVDVIDGMDEPTYYIGTGRVKANVKIGRNINVTFRCKPDYAIINDIMNLTDMRRMWDFILTLNGVLKDNGVYTVTGFNGAKIYIAKSLPHFQGDMGKMVYNGINIRLSDYFLADEATTLLDSEFDYDILEFDNSVIKIIEELLND